MIEGLECYYDAEHEFLAEGLLPPCCMVLRKWGNNTRVPIAVFGAEGKSLLMELLAAHEDLYLVDCADRVVECLGKER